MCKKHGCVADVCKRYNDTNTPESSDLICDFVVRKTLALFTDDLVAVDVSVTVI